MSVQVITHIISRFNSGIFLVRFFLLVDLIRFLVSNELSLIQCFCQILSRLYNEKDCIIYLYGVRPYCLTIGWSKTQLYNEKDCIIFFYGVRPYCLKIGWTSMKHQNWISRVFFRLLRKFLEMIIVVYKVLVKVHR